MLCSCSGSAGCRLHILIRRLCVVQLSETAFLSSNYTTYRRWAKVQRCASKQYFLANQSVCECVFTSGGIAGVHVVALFEPLYSHLLLSCMAGVNL